MDRLTLAAVSIMVSIVSLFLITYFYRCPSYDPLEFGSHVGDCVTVRGYVTDVRLVKGLCIYSIFSGSDVKAVDFDSGACKTGYVCIEGRIQMWKGEPEVVVIRYC